MSAKTAPSAQSRPMPTAPTTLERWFPIAVWLPKYNWGKFLTVDLIAAISVAALLIPESMGYATVAGLPIQIGLYAAPLALIGYAMFGGSRILVFAAAGSVAAITASINVIVYRLAAPLIFSNAEAFQQGGQDLLIRAGKSGSLPHTMILDCEEILFVDATGAGAITSLFEYAKRYGVDLKLARVHSGTHKLLQLAGVMEEIGEENIYDTIRRAVDNVTAQASTADTGQEKSGG